MLFDTEKVNDQMFRNPTLANHGWQRALYKPNGEQSIFGKIASTGLPILGGVAGAIIGGPMGAGIGAKLGSMATKGLNTAARNATENTDTYDMIDLSKSSAQSEIAPAIAQLGGAALSMGGPDAMKKLGMTASQVTKLNAAQPQNIEGGAASLAASMSAGNMFQSSSNPYTGFAEGGLAQRGPKDKSKAGSDNTRVQRPFNTIAYTPNYGRNMQPVDWTKSANVAKVEADDAAKKKLDLNRTQGYSTGTGKAEPTYPEVLLFPGSPAIRGIGKAANVAVDALNPLSGMGSEVKALVKALPGVTEDGLARIVEPFTRTIDGDRVNFGLNEQDYNALRQGLKGKSGYGEADFLTDTDRAEISRFKQTPFQQPGDPGGSWTNGFVVRGESAEAQRLARSEEIRDALRGTPEEQERALASRSSASSASQPQYARREIRMDSDKQIAPLPLPEKEALILKEIKDKRPQGGGGLSYSTNEHVIEDARLSNTDFIPKTENIDNDIGALTLMKDQYSDRLSGEDLWNLNERLQDLHSTKYLRGEFADNIKGRGYNPTLKDLSISTVDGKRNLVKPDGEIIGTIKTNGNFVGASKVKKEFMGMYDKDNRVGEALYRGISKGLKETTGRGLMTSKNFAKTTFTDANGVRVIRARGEDFWNKLLEREFAVPTPEGHLEIIKTVGGLAVGEIIRRDMSEEPEKTFAFGGLTFSDGGSPMGGPVVIHDRSDKTTEDLAMIDIKTGKLFGAMRYGERIFDQTATQKIDSMVKKAARDPKHRTPKSFADLGSFIYKETLTHKDMKDGPIGFYGGGLADGSGKSKTETPELIRKRKALIDELNKGKTWDRYMPDLRGTMPNPQLQDLVGPLSPPPDLRGTMPNPQGYDPSRGQWDHYMPDLRGTDARTYDPSTGQWDRYMPDFGTTRAPAPPQAQVPPPAARTSGGGQRRPAGAPKTPPPPLAARAILPEVKPLTRTGEYTPPSMAMPTIPGAKEVVDVLKSRETPPVADTSAWRANPTNAIMYGLTAGVAAGMTRPLPKYQLPGEYVSNMMDIKNRANGGMSSLEEGRLIDTASRGLAVANSGGRTPYAAAATSLGAQRQFNDTVLGIGALDQRVRSSNQAAYTGAVSDYTNRGLSNFQLEFGQVDRTNQALMQAAGENLDAIGADLDYQRMWENPESPFVKMTKNSRTGEKRYDDRNATLGQTALSITPPRR